jgi:hypothetical protein
MQGQKMKRFPVQQKAQRTKEKCQKGNVHVASTAGNKTFDFIDTLPLLIKQAILTQIICSVS